MGRFNQYLGKTELTVDKQKLELDVTLKEMKTILTATKGKEMTEESVDKIANVLKECMKRSYPEEPKEEIEAFIDKKFVEFLTEFSIAVGWTTREQIEQSFRIGGEPNTGTTKS